MNDDAAPPADESRDPYLRAALRHAPDAGARPPDAISERILAAARDSIATVEASRTPKRRPRRGLASLLAALWASTARPSVAGAFATIVVATLVGVLWWERPLDEAMVRPPTAAPAPASVAATPPTSEGDARPAAPAPRAEATPDARAPAKVVRPPEAFPAPAERERTARAAARAPTPKVEAPPATPSARAGGETRDAARAETTPNELRKSEPAGDARRTEDEGSAPVAVAQSRIESRGAASSSGHAALDAPADRLAQREDAARALARAPRQQLGAAPSQAPTATTLAALRARVLSAPDQWTWTRDGTTDRRPAAALSEWLADVERAAQGFTASASANTAAKDATSNAGAAVTRTEVELFEAGRREAVLRITPGGVELVESTGRVRRIPLDPPTAAALAASVPR